MKEQIITSFQAVKGKINSQNRTNCFEIFGYDFLIDSEFKCWFIEVNTNPCLETSSTLLSCLIPRMIDDAFRLTLDQILIPPSTNNNAEYTTKYPLTGYNDNENLWDKLDSFVNIKKS